jgi:type I restriction enzyme R subunit
MPLIFGQPWHDLPGVNSLALRCFRQTATSEALDEILHAVQQDVERRREQAARGLDGLSYFVLCRLNDEGVKSADSVCKKAREAFVEFPNWRRSQNELRELRQKVTFAIYAEEDDLDKVSALVDSIFSVLQRTGEA